MYEVKEVAGVVQLLKDKKEVTGLENWAKFGIQLLNQGKNFNEIPSSCPFMLCDIFSYIDEHLPEERTLSEETRLRVMKENLHQLEAQYRKNPSPENEKLVVNLNKTYENFLKQAKTDTSVFIHYSDPFPEDFLKRIEPENPNSDEDLDKWRKMLDSLV